MDNFSYYNPVRVYFGAGQIARIADEIAQDKRVMVVYGQGSVKTNGILNQVKSSLGNSTVYEFGGIEPNPHYETLLHAIDIVRTEHIDYLLAVGGGSVIDGTKFIAAAAKYAGDIWDIIDSRGEVVEDAIPLGCVLTLSATGSEMNTGASIMRAVTRDKLFFRSVHVLPQFSVLDPETTYTLPQRQTANGVVDAFVHVLEQYITWPVNASVQDRMAEGILNTLKEEGPKVLSMPGDYDARANIMWSATIALNGLLRTGVPEDWSSHMIGMELTGLYGLDHARTLAVLIPAVWNYKINEKSEKLAQYATRVWGIPKSNRIDMARQAIQCTTRFFELMGMKTHLSDYGLGAEIIPEVLNKLREHGHTALGECHDITPENVESILRIAL